MQVYRIKALLKQSSIGQRVKIQGWLRTRRDSKSGFSFLEVNDGSCLGNLQVIAESKLENYESEIKKLGPGSSVAIEGTVVASQGKEQAIELSAESVVVHGMADADYPLQKKRHGFDYLRTVAHLRPRTNTFGAVARIRDVLAHATHGFFKSKGFFYIHTPIITGIDCEGAGEMFQVTTMDLANIPKNPDGTID